MDPHPSQVAYPHCATCFGRCYPGGAALVMDAKNMYDGIGRLLRISPSRDPIKPVINVEGKSISENGDLPAVENGIAPGGEQTVGAGADERETSPTLQTSERHSDD